MKRESSLTRIYVLWSDSKGVVMILIYTGLKAEAYYYLKVLYDHAYARVICLSQIC